MICLKNRTFAVSQTTVEVILITIFLLWFAWKIVLLQYRKQQTFNDYAGQQRCDLLEKSYFCSIANNLTRAGVRKMVVVICLKNRTFAVSQTTGSLDGGVRPGCDLLEKSYFCSIANNAPTNWPLLLMLWFAWKIVLLQYRKQLAVSIIRLRRCCDLLEKSYFCSIANNYGAVESTAFAVVICLKNRTFAVSQTTTKPRLCWTGQLWFAWKIVLLQYRKQLGVGRGPFPLRCDLLEKSYFCSIANNLSVAALVPMWLWFAWKIVLLQYRKQQHGENKNCSLVVICLKNRTFAVSQTTILIISAIFCSLWFAWKIVLLQYRKQRSISKTGKRVGCDLLEKSYFCSIANNTMKC